MVDDTLIWKLIAGRISYCTLIAAHDLEIFEKLSGSKKTLVELSDDLGMEERPVEALILMLVNLGFVSSIHGKYELTDVSKKYLLKESEMYFGGMLALSNKINWTCEELKQSAVTNSPQVYGGDNVFDSHLYDDEKSEKFTNAMHSASMSPALGWPGKIDLSCNKMFLDVGGGSGAHIIGALKKWSAINAILLDHETVITAAQKILTKYNFGSRLEYVSDDFWECIYPEADVHFYSQIFHDWPEEKCLFLAEKSCKTLPKDGKIIIHEMLFDDDKSGPLMASAGNVGMLAWTEGKQYSGEELKNILKISGFQNIEITPTVGYWSIVVGTK